MGLDIFRQRPDLIPHHDGEKSRCGSISKNLQVLTWLDYGSSNQGVHLRHLHTGLINDYRYPHQIVRCTTDGGTRYGNPILKEVLSSFLDRLRSHELA